jgi:hypothetical protein
VLFLILAVIPAAWKGVVISMLANHAAKWTHPPINATHAFCHNFTLACTSGVLNYRTGSAVVRPGQCPAEFGFAQLICLWPASKIPLPQATQKTIDLTFYFYLKSQVLPALHLCP